MAETVIESPAAASVSDRFRIIAATIAILASVCVAATLVLIALTASTPGVTGLPGSGSRTIDGLFGLSLLAYPLVGALIIARQPQNRIGWILASGLFLLLSNLSHELALYTLVTEPSLASIGRYSAWLANWLPPVVFFAMASLLLLLFPDGRLLSSRWRLVAWLTLTAAAALALGFALDPGPLDTPPFELVENPLGVNGIDGALQALILFGFLGFLISLLASVASLIVRFLRSRGVEREQLKWVLAAAAFLPLSWISGSLLQEVIFIESESWSDVSNILLNLGATLIPISIGIAILRYRLYDIDIIINRALVYGLLTAFLAGLYAAAIQLFKVLFESATGETSQGSIIITTLLLAAAFTPAKNRLQKLVDRYFGTVHTSRSLDLYTERVSALIQVLDARENARQFLQNAIESFNLKGGAAYLYNDGHPAPVATVGEADGDQPLRVPFGLDGHEAGYLLLGPHTDGLDYTPEEIEALEAAAKVVGQAVSLTEGLRLQRETP
jgi:hypothetical protein